ncbi:hypothetical protein LTS18_006023, partial [Coniosporium uncinatum]
MEQHHPRTIVIVVHKRHVKTVKNALEARKSLDRRVKVRPLSEELDEDLYQPDHFLLPTNVPADPPDDGVRKSLEDRLLELSLEPPARVIERDVSSPEVTFVPERQNALTKAVGGWLRELPNELQQALHVTVERLLHGFPTTYS